MLDISVSLKGAGRGKSALPLRVMIEACSVVVQLVKVSVPPLMGKALSCGVDAERSSVPASMVTLSPVAGGAGDQLAASCQLTPSPRPLQMQV